MFKAITHNITHHRLIDTDFDICLPLPYEWRPGMRGDPRYIFYNGVFVNICSKHINFALSIILEYKKRNMNVAKNLALYYLLLDGTVCQNLAHAKLWFSQYCPELGFYGLSKCILNKINQYKWIKLSHHR